MLKLRSISKIDFDNYTINKSNFSHFMQTSSWGEYEKVTANITPHYLGLINEKDEIIAATLLLEEHLPMNYCCFYAPRGFVIDYKDKRLFSIFTQKIKEFAKYKKAVSIRINPAIVYKTYDKNNQENINKDSEKILAYFKELGYKKQSDLKLPEYNYTIDLTRDLKEIHNKYSKNTKEKLISTEKYDIELVVGTTKDLQELFILKEELNDQPKYETLYEIFSNNEETKVTVFLGKLHITKTIKTLERELQRINNQMSIIPIDHLDTNSKQKLANLKEQKEKTTKDIEKFRNYKIKYGNYLTISANLMMEHNNTIWTLSEGSNHILDETNLSYRIYDEYIKYYKDKGFTLFKQLSPIEPNSHNTFKEEFGGDFTEYIGEYDLIINKFMNFIQKRIISIFNKKKETTNGTSKSIEERI